MPAHLKELLERLTHDPWRQAAGFSPEIVAAQTDLFDSSKDPIPVVSRWIQRHQPCLFGRLAAKLNLIHYCILREDDLTCDESVRDQIQGCRRRWIRDAFEGKASAFVILLISPRIAHAVPDEHVAALAHRLCTLYLREVDVQFDATHHERIWLAKQAPIDGVGEEVIWQWLAGVNYFCAQADKRWWHDHRIPGGIALSVNSIGHLVKATRLSELMNSLYSELGIDESDSSGGTINSLNEALKFAMLTIDNAAEAISGMATNLIDIVHDEGSLALPSCPVKLPTKIANKDHCTYNGWYHTDHTLPSEYFRSDVERPALVPRHDLDFTYLFENDVDNPAFESMGRGQRIRADGDQIAAEHPTKYQRMEAVEVLIEDCEMLRSALST